MDISRRGFLGGIIAACAAPAIIRTAGLIMPIKPVIIGTDFALTVDKTFIITAIQQDNGLLTINEITREAVKLWQDKFSLSIQQHNTTFVVGDKITISGLTTRPPVSLSI